MTVKVLNDKQAREAKRAESLDNLYKASDKIYPLYPAFNKVVNTFNTNIADLQTYIPKKSVNGSGIVVDKDTLKKSIATMGATICSRTFVYAGEIKNNVLVKAVSYSYSFIENLREAEVLGFVNGLVETVTPLLTAPDFADYMVTEEMLTGITKSAELYNDNIGVAEQATGAGHRASRTINQILRSISGDVAKFSKLINFFEEKYPDFVGDYHIAAAISQVGIHHSGIRGIITNSISGQPLKGVTITGESKSKTAITDAAGAFEIIKLMAGNKQFTITAPGFEPQAVTIKIIRGKIVDCSVSLQAKVINLAATA